MTNPIPDLDYTATATLLGIAYQLEGRNARRADVARRFGDLVQMATEAAPILQAATWTVAEDKFPNTVVGVIDAVDGNCLIYHDDDVDAKQRQVYAGFDLVSRAALGEAARIVDAGGDRKARISYGWVFGKNQHGEAPMRRLYRVVAITGRPAAAQRPELDGRQDGPAAPQGPPPARQTPPAAQDRQAAPAAAQRPAPAVQYDESPFDDTPAAPQAPQAQAPQTADGPCPDMPDPVWQLIGALGQYGPDWDEYPPNDELLAQVNAACDSIDRKDKTQVARDAAQLGIRDVRRPTTVDHVRGLADVFASLYCVTAVS